MIKDTALQCESITMCNEQCVRHTAIRQPRKQIVKPCALRIFSDKSQDACCRTRRHIGVVCFRDEQGRSAHWITVFGSRFDRGAAT
eukprot:4281102-Pleurochrysis_carterae.AAC.2